MEQRRTRRDSLATIRRTSESAGGSPRPRTSARVRTRSRGGSAAQGHRDHRGRAAAGTSRLEEAELEAKGSSSTPAGTRPGSPELEPSVTLLEDDRTKLGSMGGRAPSSSGPRIRRRTARRCRAPAIELLARASTPRSARPPKITAARGEQAQQPLGRGRARGGEFVVDAGQERARLVEELAQSVPPWRRRERSSSAFLPMRSRRWTLPRPPARGQRTSGPRRRPGRENVGRRRPLEIARAVVEA